MVMEIVKNRKLEGKAHQHRSGAIGCLSEHWQASFLSGRFLLTGIFFSPWSCLLGCVFIHNEMSFISTHEKKVSLCSFDCLLYGIKNVGESRVPLFATKTSVSEHI